MKKDTQRFWTAILCLVIMVTYIGVDFWNVKHEAYASYIEQENEVPTIKESVSDETTVIPQDLKDVTVNDSNLKRILEFNGKDRTPIVILNFNGTRLNINADYEVKYKNNFYPGTATVTITGIGNYTGEIVRTFKIIAKPISKVTIRTGFNAQKQPVVSANNGSYSMTKGRDYSWTSVTDGYGNITITIKGLGKNYSGTAVRKIAAADNPNRPVNPKRAVLTTAKNKKKKKIQVSWKKLPGVTGYEMRYSTGRNFKKAKTVKKNTTKYTINNLKKKKTYYIQVGGYMVYHGKTYCGNWSKYKKVKITK